MDTGIHIDETRERLIEDDDPEAYVQQRVPRAADEGEETAELNDEPPEQGLAGEEVDLVRSYLRQIGRRKLLRGTEEAEIGRRIETERNALQAALSAIPLALRTFLDLAERVRKGEVPAA